VRVSNLCALCVNVCCVQFDISSHIIQHFRSLFLANVFALWGVIVACVPLRWLPGKQQRTRQRSRTRQSSRVGASVQCRAKRATHGCRCWNPAAAFLRMRSTHRLLVIQRSVLQLMVCHNLAARVQLVCPIKQSRWTAQVVSGKTVVGRARGVSRTAHRSCLCRSCQCPMTVCA
jgi:hypothetical protein